jgi:hypothetical protein
MDDPDFTWRPLGENSEPGTPTGPQTRPAQPPAPVGAAPPAAARPEPGPLPPSGAVATMEAPAEEADWDDLDGIPLPKAPMPASIRYMSVAIIVALAFTMGVGLQKRHDYGFAPPAAGLAAMAKAGAAAAAAAAAAGGGAGAGPTVPQLIGTVVQVTGSDLVVKDAAGVEHTVHTSGLTKIVREEAVGGLTPGAPVTVAGMPGPSGNLDAAAVIESSTAPAGAGATAPTAPPVPPGSTGSTGSTGPITPAAKDTTAPVAP